MLISQAIQQLDQLQTQLPQVLSGQLRTSELIATARQSKALTQALPEKFDRVLQDILDRLESGALFTEESCSSVNAICWTVSRYGSAKQAAR